MTRDEAAALDRADPLAAFRDRFDLPPGIVYLDGNSLGALPRRTAARIAEVVAEEWGRGLIGSWNTGWLDLPMRIGVLIAGLVGARPHEVIAADSTSVNLFKLLVAALRLRPGRHTILAAAGDFPTDLHIAAGAAETCGATLRTVPADAIAAGEAVGDDTAVVLLTHVDFRSGRVHDMTAITRGAQARGAVMLWDLSHSAGALPCDLGACGADMAVGCGYKYLNGGPGAPAWLYVAERHQAALSQPITGWMGADQPFSMSGDYVPAPGLRRCLAGTPAVIGLAALEVGCALVAEADMTAVRAKSIALGDLFLNETERRLGGFAVACPRDGAGRGSQVALCHPHAYPIVRALIDRGVVGDFRAPDVLRFGLAPLYLRYVDVWDAVDRLAAIMDEGAWDRPDHHQRRAVT